MPREEMMSRPSYSYLFERVSAGRRDTALHNEPNGRTYAFTNLVTYVGQLVYLAFADYDSQGHGIWLLYMSLFPYCFLFRFWNRFIS